MKNLKMIALACLALPALASAKHVIADGKNSLEVNGQLGTAFETGVKQDTTTSYKNTKYNGVVINTANIAFSGAIDEQFVYRFRLRMKQENSSKPTDTTANHTHSAYNMVDYALAGYSFMPQLTVVMGKVDVGGGFDYQSSIMSPLTFAQDADVFFGMGTANGVRAFGTFMEMIEWSLTAVNSYDYNGTSKFEAANDNRSMDYVASIGHHSKDAADAEGYNATGDFKHAITLDYAQLDNGKTPNHRKIYAANGFFSYQNAILHTAMTTETTKQRHDDFWTVGAGYLFNKTFRPALTVSSVRSFSVTGDKGTHRIFAANLTRFHADNKWRSYAEVSMTSKSSEAKLAASAAAYKNVTPWKASVGMTVNF